MWREVRARRGCFCLVAKLCLTLCDPMDCSPPGSSVHGILQREYWSELPFPPPGDLPDPGIEPQSPTLQANSLPFWASRAHIIMVSQHKIKLNYQCGKAYDYLGTVASLCQNTRCDTDGKIHRKNPDMKHYWEYFSNKTNCCFCRQENVKNEGQTWLGSFIFF